MPPANRWISFTAILFAAFAAPLTADDNAKEPDGGQATEAERIFALKVRPLLQEKCLGCHGKDPENLESSFDMRSRESLLRGGDLYGEEVLIPGKAKESPLYAMVERSDPDLAMPPKEAEKLTQEEAWSIRDWINGGAPWPDDARVAQIYKRYASGVTVATSGGLSDEWTNRKYKPEDLWAYQPLRFDEPPEEGKNAIDHYVARKLKALSLSPAPRAKRRILIRRAAFDLAGLPPTPAEVEAFVDDKRDDDEAYSALVDRLLASPHYGEQWGRHWLDVVRYADSSGFANDWERPNAWRYRDYVIRAFNQDKPYDQFVREQLAGDEIDPDSSEHLIAAGFLRMGPWEHTGMSVAKVTRQQFLDDITDAVGQVFLAHPLQCCRCHDHKFDPLPTRDYYSIQAVFATTQFAEVDAPWLDEENRSGMESDRKYLEKRLQANRQMLSELSSRKRVNQRKWFADRGLPYKNRNEAIKAGVKEENLPPRNGLKTPDDFGRERIGRKWQQRFPWELDRYRPVAFSVYNGKTQFNASSTGRRKMPKNPMGPGVLQTVSILKGGDVFAPVEKVEPGVLSAVPGALQFKMTGGPKGRRSALAAWITDRKNTLTARVIANRVWQYHFGRGLAGNPNNFGATGKKPTHPELLDWLANELMDHDWSLKHLHRVIMTSETYQRDADHPNPDELAKKDPSGESYAAFTPRRLTAEELRDAMLAVSGELVRTVGGIPARPDMNLEAALQPRMIMGTFAPSYVPDPKPVQRNRRSVYALKLRGARDPFLEAFNQPGSEKSCELRDTSTVAPQALTLLNSEETNDRALAFASRVLKECESDEDAIRRVFALAFGRLPEAEEQELSLDHWRAMQRVQTKLTFEPRKFPTTVVRKANEENTGETFTFTERLFVYDDYVPDLQPHQVDARTRALADLCLAILNSNEFAYVY